LRFGDLSATSAGSQDKAKRKEAAMHQIEMELEQAFLRLMEEAVTIKTGAEGYLHNNKRGLRVVSTKEDSGRLR
jgi:hypothetical protein